jgi:predicted dehydrogenase
MCPPRADVDLRATLAVVRRGGNAAAVRQSPDTISDDTSGRREITMRGQKRYQRELQRFVDCMRGRADPELLDVDRAIEALAMSIATQRSLKQARSIAL